MQSKVMSNYTIGVLDWCPFMGVPKEIHPTRPISHHVHEVIHKMDRFSSIFENGWIDG